MCSDTYTYSTFMNTTLLTNPSPLLPSLPAFNPLHKWTTPFYLLGDPFFGDHGANVHPHSSLVGDRLPTPCFPMFTETTSQHQLHCLIQSQLGCMCVYTSLMTGLKKGSLEAGIVWQNTVLYRAFIGRVSFSIKVMAVAKNRPDALKSLKFHTSQDKRRVCRERP
jgi:hypothetical protein